MRAQVASYGTPLVVSVQHLDVALFIHLDFGITPALGDFGLPLAAPSAPPTIASCALLELEGLGVRMAAGMDPTRLFGRALAGGATTFPRSPASAAFPWCS